MNGCLCRTWTRARQVAAPLCGLRHSFTVCGWCVYAGSDVRIDALVGQTATLRPRRDAAYKRRLQDRVERAKHDPKKRCVACRWQSRRGVHVQLALLYDTRRTKVKVLTTNVRHNAEFRGFRIDKDREAEVAAVSAACPCA